MSWSYLCRKHFKQEKDKIAKKGGGWTTADFDVGDTCDYEGCTNKPYREVYYDLKIKDYPNWFVRLMNKIDFRYWNCRCGWARCGELHFADCPKHGLSRWRIK